MKKIFSIGFIFCCATGIAQNVGVGEVNPTEMKLQVKRTDSALLLLQNATTTGSDNKTGLFYKTGNYYSGSIATIGTGTSFRMGLFTFGSLTPEGLLERMSILDGGNVGIGTTTPTEKFTVNAGGKGWAVGPIHRVVLYCLMWARLLHLPIIYLILPIQKPPRAMD